MMNRGKHLAYQNFIVKYHNLFISDKSPNKKELKKAIEQFWGDKHGWSYGKPKEELLCSYIIDHLLQEQEINSLQELRIAVEKIGYLRLHQPNLDQYEEKINERKKDREVAPNKQVTGTVIENIRQNIIEQEGAEIELFFDLADNEFNAMKFDLFDLEALNIKYSKSYPDVVNMIRTLKSDSMAVPLSPYEGVLYLRKSRA